uniref:Uncharacterized protein n=1 Tax=Myoviridae sp. ctYA416 TaxID=2825125 RepID=A0A8S5UTE8_9CAUD|nr:MAG TPA: hypothetical protein [Myoviridae sp. ctYA416]
MFLGLLIFYYHLNFKVIVFFKHMKENYYGTLIRPCS